LNFTETKLSGAFIIEPERLQDDRGFFARSWCEKELAGHNLDTDLAQCNISFNKAKGTLRGMHYQIKPFEEAKIVRCTRGSIYDVIIDLRPDSPTLKHWTAVELNEENRNMLYVPKGFAHGFQTLADNTEIFYQISALYSPRHARGIKWNDPAFNIEWPIDTLTISDKDKSYSNYQ
tara:strand:+ start:1116 stop:1643 length:528 start_codon:yes stop_codon:yes gene_type:complete